MAGRKRIKLGRLFRRRLRVYLIILILLCFGALALLWHRLDLYQQGLDREAAEKARVEAQLAQQEAEYRAPQLAFEAFLEQADADYWTGLWFDSHPESYDDPALVRELLGTLFGKDNYQAYKAADYTEEQPRYVLKDGSRTLADIELSGSGVNWSVENVSLYLDGTHEGTIKAPDGYAIYCNGQPFDHGSVEKELKLFEMADYADRIVDPISWNTYTVTGQLLEPQLEARPPEDILTMTDEDGTVFYILSGDEAAGYKSRAESFIYDLLRYYMMGGYDTYKNQQDVLEHVAADCQARKLIYDSYDGVTWDPRNFDVSYEATASEVRVLAANCLLVEVAYHAEGTANGTHNVADGVYRVYFLDSGRGMQIFGLFYA